MNAKRTEAEQFFYRHAGYGYDPKTETKEQGRQRGARLLAEAEQYAKRHGWTATWEEDQEPDLSWMDEKEREQPHEVLCCILRDTNGVVLGSLSNIVDADKTYGRVVEAELALDAMPKCAVRNCALRRRRHSSRNIAKNGALRQRTKWTRAAPPIR